MIYVEKRETPESIAQKLSEKQQSKEWNDILEEETEAMRDFFDGLEFKDELRQALLEEQHYLCAYCMKRIQNQALHMSIEHVIPLSRCKEKVLDFQNYLGVCRGGNDLKRDTKKCICCDASKGNKLLKVVNPFDKKQMSHIKYLSSGELYYEKQPEDSEAWIKDMEEDLYLTLRLNGIYDKENRVIRKDTKTSLVKNRKDVYESCEEYIFELYEQGELTDEKIKSDIQLLLHAEQYEEYIGIRLFLLNQVYEQLINNEI